MKYVAWCALGALALLECAACSSGIAGDESKALSGQYRGWARHEHCAGPLEIDFSGKDGCQFTWFAAMCVPAKINGTCKVSRGAKMVSLRLENDDKVLDEFRWKLIGDELRFESTHSGSKLTLTKMKSTTEPLD